MRSQIRRELRACLSRDLAINLPTFKLCGKEREAGGQNLIWAWEIARELTLFVAFDPVDDEDQFNVEIAWSENGKFPWHEIGNLKIEKPDGRERLGHLAFKVDRSWDVVRSLTHEERKESRKARTRGDHDEANRIRKLVDVPLDEAIQRVDPLVKDAVQKLIEFGLPSLRRVVEHRGITWPMG